MVGHVIIDVSGLDLIKKERLGSAYEVHTATWDL